MHVADDPVKKPDPRYPWSPEAMRRWTLDAPGQYLHLDEWPPGRADTATLILEVIRTIAAAEYEIGNLGNESWVGNNENDKAALVLFEAVVAQLRDELLRLRDKYRPKPPPLSAEAFDELVDRIRDEEHQKLVDEFGESGATFIEHPGCPATTQAGTLCRRPTRAGHGIFCWQHHDAHCWGRDCIGHH